MKKSIASLLILFFSLTIISCSSSSEPVANNTSLSFTLDKTTLNKTTADEIFLESAKILIKDIKFRQSSNDSTNFKAGPLVVQLKLDGAVTEVGVVDLPQGNYNKVKFRIHKPDETESIPDSEFREGQSADLRYSVIVKGKFNNISFVYKSSKTATQDVDFQSPLYVSSSEVNNVTLLVDVGTWFKKDGQILNPSLVANHNDIDNNIKVSFKKAYKDNNKDGRQD